MKKYKIFLFSAVLFLLANNMHFVISSGLVPRILDILATGLLAYGLYKIYLG